MTFTTLVWIFNFLCLVVAFFVYVPLVLKIRGNLKEYCCHKLDKRITEILRLKSKKRFNDARKAELAHLEKSNRARVKGESLDREGSLFEVMSDDANSSRSRILPPAGYEVGPTLPNISEDDFFAPHPVTYIPSHW